ncbi:MAG: cupin domain-containing protein [Burkholderiales bacterium]|nr:cupin domain-containing protein [Burkholderiales bacterium]
MDIDAATPLLGGLSPARFMARHWQKQPLLVRQAWPGVQPPLGRAALFALAARDDVESRLVVREAGVWRVRQGPLPRRALPPLGRAGWTLLVQGLDGHVEAAHEMLARFRFVPDARLDDLMVSWASDGGGVGPHVDSYDVFLLQVQGRRRWRVGRVRDPAFEPDAPLKLLRHFEPSDDWLLEPGDMLYLPPRWGHDGVAVGGDCVTCSIGFRAPAADELARELLLRLADAIDAPGALYRDPAQAATATPGAVPAPLRAFAQAALARCLADPQALARALGEVLTEPKPQVWFQAGVRTPAAGLALDRATRMLYDERHVFINGEAFAASGRDARLLRRLADERRLGAPAVAGFSAPAHTLLAEWLQAGWLHGALAGGLPQDAP